MIEEQFADTGGPMIAMLDAVRAFHAIRSELEDRLDDCTESFPAQGLVVASDHQRVRILRTASGLQFSNVQAGRVDLHAGRHLGRLLMGHGRPAEIFRQCKLRCRREARPIIEALFPAQDPYISPLDTY